MKNNFTIKDEKVFIDINVKGRTVTTVIDLEDFDKVSSIEGTWSGHVDKNSGKIVCYCHEVKDGKNKKVLLHRVIMGLEYESKYVVDHLDHNSLNNSRSNLRATSMLRNAKRKNNETSKVRKVDRKHWGVFVRGELLGTYETKQQAQVMGVIANMEHFPQLEQFQCFDTALTSLGYDISTVPVNRTETGELDFSEVTLDKIRKIDSECKELNDL
ncbi:HNH endonuclease [Bacillus paralicheniformis]|uniref:HNH endonuclease n=1 Tax=Bacillus paralicheniformis TaxID=1648923 RepID=UPI00189EA144|nr:HNH endonuclease [Bacillus paralicheniformis]